MHVHVPDETRWVPPVPPASAERVEERLRMVTDLAARHPSGREPVRDAAVLRAMCLVPRHVFVPAGLRVLAYEDTPLLIGQGQTISQPYIVAKMTELLEVTPNSRILEIGTGSGYQSAVLGHLTPHVWTVEVIEALAGSAEQVLREQNYDHVRCCSGNGQLGWIEAAPFDGIIVTCATSRFPDRLWPQLCEGGRLVLPMGDSSESQWLVVLRKKPGGKHHARAVMPVRFVPMTG